MPSDYSDEQFDEDVAKATSAGGEFEDGVYGAEGDPWVYEVSDGEIVAIKDGERFPVKGGFATKAIQGQLRDGTLSKVGPAEVGLDSPAETEDAPPKQDKYADMSMQDAISDAAGGAHREMMAKNYAMQAGMPPRDILRKYHSDQRKQGEEFQGLFNKYSKKD